MRRNYNRVFVHFVWATWDRLPLLTPPVRAIVYPAIQAKCKELRCRVEALGGVEDHIHLVVHLHAAVSCATLVKEVKGASSHLATHRLTETFFKWRGAYGAVGVAPESLPSAVRYVRNQAERHASHR